MRCDVQFGKAKCDRQILQLLFPNGRHHLITTAVNLTKKILKTVRLEIRRNLHTIIARVLGAVFFAYSYLRIGRT